MLFNKKWKLRHFTNMNMKDVEKIAYNWILSEFNLIERKNMWLSQEQPTEA